MKRNGVLFHPTQEPARKAKTIFLYHNETVVVALFYCRCFCVCVCVLFPLFYHFDRSLWLSTIKTKKKLCVVDVFISPAWMIMTSYFVCCICFFFSFYFRSIHFNFVHPVWQMFARHKNCSSFCLLCCCCYFVFTSFICFNHSFIYYDQLITMCVVE